MLPLIMLGASLAGTAVKAGIENATGPGRYRPPSELSPLEEQKLHSRVRGMIAPEFRGAYARESADISRISATAASQGLTNTGIPLSAISTRLSATGSEINQIHAEGNRIFSDMYSETLQQKIAAYDAEYERKLNRARELGGAIEGGIGLAALMYGLNAPGAEKVATLPS